MYIYRYNPPLDSVGWRKPHSDHCMDSRKPLAIAQQVIITIKRIYVLGEMHSIVGQAYSVLIDQYVICVININVTQ